MSALRASLVLWRESYPSPSSSNAEVRMDTSLATFGLLRRLTPPSFELRRRFRSKPQAAPLLRHRLSQERSSKQNWSIGSSRDADYAGFDPNEATVDEFAANKDAVANPNEQIRVTEDSAAEVDSPSETQGMRDSTEELSSWGVECAQSYETLRTAEGDVAKDLENGWVLSEKERRIRNGEYETANCEDANMRSHDPAVGPARPQRSGKAESNEADVVALSSLSCTQPHSEAHLAGKDLPSERNSLQTSGTQVLEHQNEGGAVKREFFNPSLLAGFASKQMSNVSRFFAKLLPWEQKKRLDHLLNEADEDRKNASKQAALLKELFKQSPQAVIERFERREHAANEEAVVQYIKALVVTDAIADFLPDQRTGRSSGLSALLLDLKRAAGDLEEPLVPPGMTEQKPLHVVMVDSKVPNKSMRLVQELLYALFFMIFFSILWVMGTAALRKYVNGAAGIGPSSSIGASSVYSPKEFSKEVVPEKNTKTFKDVKGCDEAKQELEEIVEYLRNPAKFTRLGGKLPKGVLLVGPPGTGKTLLAKAIAGEAAVPFFYRAGSEFEEMFVGVGARRVRSLFQAAKKKAPCIVFIDEIDAVGSSRKHWEGHTKKTLNQLLVEMDGFEANEGIIVLAATNLPESLDPALIRPGRFDRHVVVMNPDVRGRQEILELYMKDKPLSDDVDVKILARGTPGFSGADLANLVNMAAVKAAIDGVEKITAAQLEFAKDKLLMGAERKSMVLSEESKKLTAYHESGHAVVAFNTAGANPIHKATIMPRGTALGMVTQLPEKDETSVSKVQLMARLDVCMGGRAAEEIVFGSNQITSGARSDLQQATALARHMVSECGMSETVGPIFVDADTQRPSPEIQKSIDAEVLRLLKEAYERALSLLKKHEADLHNLAKALLENETLNADEVKEILQPIHQAEEMISATNADMLH